MLKKTTLAVMGLAVSGFALAGTMGPVCAPGNVTVPCEAKRWDLGVQALYLQSIYSGSKAYQHSLLPTGSVRAVDNDWDWGSRLEGSYHFNTGNDVTIDWTHFSSNKNEIDLAGYIPLNARLVVTNQPVAQYSKDKLDQVNVVMGQHADFGMVKKMRFFGGMQYAHLQIDSTNYFGTRFTSPPYPVLPFSSVSQFDNTDYKGFGPVIGIDYAYELSNAFSLTARGAGSILYGTSRYSNGYVGAPVNLVFASRSNKVRTIVPSLDAKLGVNYAYSVGQGILNLEGGYQALNYFNALQTQGIAGFAGQVTNSDYGLYGPYFGLKYVGNA